jgi:hypothetical protein
VEADFVGNEKFYAIDVPYRDANLFRAPENLVTPIVQTLQIGREMRFLDGIMDDVLFEIGSDLRYKIGTLTITLKQVIHLGFDDLLDMRLFNIVRRDIKTDAERSYDNDAEHRKCQCNTQTKAALKPRHGK